MGDEAGPGRKDWIENRLKELDQIFAVSVGGFSLMDNHLHLLLRIDPEVANGWSDSEVVERWFRLFPPRGSDRKPMKVSKEMVAARVGNADRPVQKLRSDDIRSENRWERQDQR
jgi:hypothetical protein